MRTSDPASFICDICHLRRALSEKYKVAVKEGKRIDICDACRNVKIDDDGVHDGPVFDEDGEAEFTAADLEFLSSHRLKLK